MASTASRKQASSRPKKYPDAKKPHEVIQEFFNQQPDTRLETEFMMYAARTPLDYGLHMAWLSNNGLPATVPQIKAWLKVKGIDVGSEAKTLNSRTEGYAGVNAIAALEAMAVKTSQICFSYGNLINERLEAGDLNEAHITSVIAQYPSLILQNKQILQALTTIKEKTQERELLVSGAERIKHLVLTMLETNSPHKSWLNAFFEAAIAKMIEETD